MLILFVYAFLIISRQMVYTIMTTIGTCIDKLIVGYHYLSVNLVLGLSHYWNRFVILGQCVLPDTKLPVPNHEYGSWYTFYWPGK